MPKRLKWYRRAAEQGNVAAQYTLGNMYYNGAGVPQDYVQSHMWLNPRCLQCGWGMARVERIRCRAA